MTYNLQNPLDARNAQLRLDALVQRGSIVELTEKKPKRSLAQNAYLHVALGYLAVQTGYTLEWVKREYYKKICNPDLFIVEKEDTILHRTVKCLRSSAELTKGEMSLSIDRFRNWCSSVAEVYIPSPEEEAECMAMQMEVERNKQWIY